MDKKNVTKEEVKKLIEEIKLIPTRGKLIVTMNTDTYEEGEFEDDLSILSEYQYVLAVGPNITFVEAGDKVLLDLAKMTVPVSGVHDAFEQNAQIQIDPVIINDTVC